MSITGEEGGEPTRVGVSIGDIAAALFATTGILAALLISKEGGGGQKVDISMLDAQVALLENALARYGVTGEIPTPLANRHPSITPFTAFKTSDRTIVVAAGNDRLFQRLCYVLKRPHLLEDDRFCNNESRTTWEKELFPLLQEAFLERGASYWLELLQEGGIPCAPIQDISQVIQDPQLRSRGMIQDLFLPGGETLPLAGTPLNFSKTSCSQMTPPPKLGEHTKEILQRFLSLKDEEYERLLSKGII